VAESALAQGADAIIASLLQYPQADRRNGEGLTPPLASLDEGYSARETLNKSSSFAPGSTVQEQQHV